MSNELSMSEQIENAVRDEIATGGVTCEQVFADCEDLRHTQFLDIQTEEVRKDYNACVTLHSDLLSHIDEYKAQMKGVEDEMNALAGGKISQELFTRHYQVVRDLTQATGIEPALILRRASSGVVLLHSVKGSLPN